MEGHHGFTLAGECRDTRGRWGHRDLWRQSPQKGAQLPGDRHTHPLGVCTACASLSRALAEPHLGLPTDLLDGCGHLCHTPLEVTTDFRGIPGSPGPFDEGTARVGVADCGARALGAMVACGIFYGCQAAVTQQLAGLVDTCQVAQCGDAGNRDSERDAAQGLERVDAGTEAPGRHAGLEFLCEPSKTFALCGYSADVCLENDVLRGGGPDDLTAPAQGSWAPGRLPRRTDIMAQQKGFEPMLGRLELAQGICPSPAQVTEGFVSHLGDRDGRQSTGAPQTGQLERVTPICCAPIASLFGDQRGGDNPAGVAFLGEGAGEPRPTRTCFIDKHEMLACGRHFSEKLGNIALARSKSTQGADLGVEVWGDIRHGHRVFLASHANGERARLWHGGPPRSCGCCGIMWLWLTKF